MEEIIKSYQVTYMSKERGARILSIKLSKVEGHWSFSIEKKKLRTLV